MANRSGDLSGKRVGYRIFPTGRIFELAHQGIGLIYPAMWVYLPETNKPKTGWSIDMGVISLAISSIIHWVFALGELHVAEWGTL